jgi:hypothetical protein
MLNDQTTMAVNGPPIPHSNAAKSREESVLPGGASPSVAVGLLEEAFHFCVEAPHEPWHRIRRP